MTTVNNSTAIRLSPPGAALRSAAGMALLVLLALALAAAVYRFPPPSLGFLLAGGLTMLGVVALAVARFDAAVALGFLLLGVVKVEPAPPDMVFAIVLAVAAVTGRFDLSRVPLAVGGAVGSFLVLNLLSAMEAVSPEEAGVFFSITLYLAVFSLWLTGYLNSSRRARWIVLAWLVAAVGSTVMGLAALGLPVPGRGFLLYGDEFAGQERIEGLFKDANVFGPFLIPVALILLEEIINPRLLRMRLWTKGALFALLAVGVLFSYSRAAWGNLALGVAAMLLVIALRRGGGRRAALVLSVTVVVAVAASAVIAFTGSLGFLGERASFQTYDVERFGAQAAGIELAERYPLGIGPGQFGFAAEYDAHSLYVRTFAEQGLLGLLSIVVLVGGTLLMAARNALAGRSTYGIGSAALFGAWCGLALNSFFIDTLHWRHLWVVAALIWVGSMASSRPEPAPAPRSAPPDAGQR